MFKVRFNITFLITSYLFWGCFWWSVFQQSQSFIPWIMAVFPPLALVIGAFYFKSLAIPLLFSMTCAIAAQKYFRGAGSMLYALLFNTIVLTAFIVAGDVFIIAAQKVQSRNLLADCTASMAFHESLFRFGRTPGHTVIFSGGRVYQWSCSLFDFYENTNARQPDLRLEMCHRHA